MRLALPDVRRRTEPQYRAGWNAWTPGAPAPAPIAAQAPASPLPPTAPAPAPAIARPASDFTEADIANIVASSRGNEIRFNRDFKGRLLLARGSFTSASETWTKGEYRVSMRTAGGGVDCITTDPEILNAASNWNAGQPVVIQGAIRTTLMGDVLLSPGCQVSAWRR
jgi:hypothetical protein